MCEHWCAALEPLLTERLSAALSDTNLLDELALTALRFAPRALTAALHANVSATDLQVTLLTAVHRARSRLGKSAGAKLRRFAGTLPLALRETFSALPTGKRKATKVNSEALSLILNCASKLGQDALDLVVPVIIASGGNAEPAVARWLTVAMSKEDAMRAAEAAIAIGDTALVEQALHHKRADARRLALLCLAPTFQDPLPQTLLTMASDPSSRVRRALIALLRERLHPNHLITLLGLLHDTWSSAEPQDYERESFDIARESVLAVARYDALSDEVGDMLFDLAVETGDRTLSQYALTVAAHCCSTKIQKKILALADLPKARWIRLDALDALARADAVASEIVEHVTPKFLLTTPPVLAVAAAHLAGIHAPPKVAFNLFGRIASSNERRALLLVGANAVAEHDRATAEQILNLLEPGHPARDLLISSELLPASILDDLGTVQMREVVQKRLQDRISS